MKSLVLEKAKVENNINVIREKVGDAQIIAVVKGKGYGFGILQYARLLQSIGLDFFAVATLEEAKTLREGGFDGRLMLLSPTEIASQAQDVVDMNLVAAIGSAESAIVLNNAAAAAGVSIKAHLAIDSGFGRFGFLPEDVSKIKPICDSLTNVEIEGIFSHLSASFIKKKKLTQIQLDAFRGVVEKLESEGLTFAYKHLANSCAVFMYPETVFNCVRVGSAFIGRLPMAKHTGLEACGHLEVEVDDIRYLPANHNIGYANTYTTKTPTKIAVLSIGYGDGLAVCKAHDTYRFVDKLRYTFNDFKAFFKKDGIYCTINGTAARILGRVGLSNCVADVTNVTCAAGDVAKFNINPLYVDSSVTREMR